jgi:hypothetical protein
MEQNNVRNEQPPEGRGKITVRYGSPRPSGG